MNQLKYGRHRGGIISLGRRGSAEPVHSR